MNVGLQSLSINTTSNLILTFQKNNYTLNEGIDMRSNSL